MDHIKASITSTFGSILKMDSTKKITKKLSGHAKGTALWVTYGNEVGQIVTSVLTVQEGPGLDTMVSGVMERGMGVPLLEQVCMQVCSCLNRGHQERGAAAVTSSRHHCVNSLKGFGRACEPTSGRMPNTL
ncbi:hypothetical protein KUCAC02_032316, partial [Chaenocephalus aceratus]